MTLSTERQFISPAAGHKQKRHKVLVVENLFQLAASSPKDPEKDTIQRNPCAVKPKALKRKLEERADPHGKINKDNGQTEIAVVYWGYIGIMDKKMETTTL